MSRFFFLLFIFFPYISAVSMCHESILPRAYTYTHMNYRQFLLFQFRSTFLRVKICCVSSFWLITNCYIDHKVVVWKLRLFFKKWTKIERKKTWFDSKNFGSVISRYFVFSPFSLCSLWLVFLSSSSVVIFSRPLISRSVEREQKTKWSTTK